MVGREESKHPAQLRLLLYHGDRLLVRELPSDGQQGGVAGGEGGEREGGTGRVGELRPRPQTVHMAFLDPVECVLPSQEVDLLLGQSLQ